jgi:hypothetical protein
MRRMGGLPYLVGNLFELVGIRLRQLCNARGAGLPSAAHFGSIDPEVVYLLQRRKLQRHQSVAHCVHIKML